MESGNKMLRIEIILEYYQNALSFKGFKFPAFLDRMWTYIRIDAFDNV